MDTVGAVVALENGAPYKKRYRTYHVRGVAEGDDYAAMYQVLARRFRRGRDAQARAAAAQAPGAAVAVVEEASFEETPQTPEVDGAEAAPDEALAVAAVDAAAPPPGERAAELGDWELPDLFVVDGGRGQLAIALTAARDLGLHDLRVVGLAKERETALGDKLVDRVYLPNQKNPIPLRPNSPELFILARARDEAHRFANRGRKKVGKRRRIASELESIPGVGPKTRKALLTTLGSLQGIRDATDEQILAVPGVTKKQLSALRSWFAVAEAMKNSATS
jgi:excinuclease ABC subunit C